MDITPYASEHTSSRRKRATPRVIEHSSSVDEESFKSDKQSEDEDHNKDNESEPGSGNSGDDSEDDGSDDDDDNAPGSDGTGGNTTDTSILHHAFISIFIAIWAVTTHYVTILMPFLSYFTRFT